MLEISNDSDMILSALYKIKNALQDGIEKNANNPFFKSAYPDLNQHLKTIEPILYSHGCVLIQPTSSSDMSNYVSSIIFHVKSGQWIKSSMMFNKISDPQKAVAAVTYFRRATLNALLALKSVDDDGNTASGKRVNKTSTSKFKSNKVKVNYDDEF